MYTRMDNRYARRTASSHGCGTRDSAGNSLLVAARCSAGGVPAVRRCAVGLALSGMIGVGAVQAEEAAGGVSLDPLVIDFRGERVDSPRYTRDLLDTPRIVTVLPQDLLEEQNTRSLRDAMRNVTGISLQAGEGNPPGGDQLKIRGFNARDDINVNSARDLGNYFRDPFYVEQIEVIKGPNSAFSGRGSAGGTVNFVTKKPQPRDFGRIETSVGTDALRRATADINQTLDANSAFRLNLMGHSSDVPGRDVVEERRHGVYGAYSWGFQRDTLVTVDYLHTRQSDIPDQGLPFDRETRNDRGAATGRLPSGIDFSNFYGYRDDYRKVDVDQVRLAVEHFFSPAVSVRNQTRYSVVETDALVSSPRIRTRQERDPDNPGQGSLEGAFGIGDLKPRDQQDVALFNQTDLLVSFATGPVEHDSVFGLELGRTSQENRRRPDVSGDDLRVDLIDPSYRNRTRPRVQYDGSVHTLETEDYGVYWLNTMRFTPQWELNTGVRFDRVEATASERGHERGFDGSPTRENIDDLERTDEEVSWSLGLVYKPVRNASIYAAVGTAYQTSATFDRDLVQLAGGPRREGDVPGEAQPRDRAVASPDTFDIDPEKTVAYEVGAKWQVLTGLNLNAALFRTDKTNARTPALGQDDAVEVLDGEQRVEGFELIATGFVTPQWRVYAGYTYMRSEVRQSNNPFEIGQSLGGTPRHSYNLYTTYDVTSRITVGGGLFGVSGHGSSIQPASDADTIASEGRLAVSIPGYTVYDLSATYRFTEQAQFRVNATNIFDKDYISQMAEGGAQGIPGPGRQVVGTFRYDF